MSVPVGRRSVAPKPPDLHRLASYNRGGGRSRRRLPVLPILLILLLLAVGAGGFVLGRLTAPGTEVVAESQSTGTTVPMATSSTVPVPVTAAVIHEIKQGENLQKIADLYGVTQEQLIAFNEISDPNKIYWGLRLRIPPADYVPPTTTAPSTTLAP